MMKSPFNGESAPAAVEVPKMVSVQLSSAPARPSVPDAESLERILKDIFNKGNLARQLLDSLALPPREAVASLLTGWNLAALAAAWFAPEIASSRDERSQSQRSELASVTEGCSKWLDRLSALFEQYVNEPPTPVSRDELDSSAADLFEAAGALRSLRFSIKTLPRAGGFHIAKKEAVYATAVLTLLALITGAALRAPSSQGHGLSAKYCSSKHPQKPCIERIDHTVDFNWKQGPPFENFPSDSFTVQWHGCLFVEKGVRPNLVVGADDGIITMVDGKRVLKDYRAGPYRIHRAPEPLKPGLHRLDIFYFEATVDARAFVGWSIKGRHPVAIPGDNLIPLGGNGEHPCPNTPAQLAANR